MTKAGATSWMQDHLIALTGLNSVPFAKMFIDSKVTDHLPYPFSS
ncbi:hypothetical protein [Acinetobacter gerneri]|uniref:Uncharacterized protein n=1 Tax=Acinetobacter gerneri DSM 14967 = CIP 107464 = MTCC 9824 TaxID=1120926 RepID=N8Y6D2_9GAMM|nr:hypothetical protein [Acinetobacter gerneri]ENV32322.1 hypothetical protein F960_03716 [Acinetobacter gerneri DSM 14967 = CIP 107464 = MTCC 9824]EPR85117.1 hypothetical protein L289_0574 [Acinetobacter gerneri DSM 14967 = CIP 107464 = MTCC 9824]